MADFNSVCFLGILAVLAVARVKVLSIQYMYTKALGASQLTSSFMLGFVLVKEAATRLTLDLDF